FSTFILGLAEASSGRPVPTSHWENEFVCPTARVWPSEEKASAYAAATGNARTNLPVVASTSLRLVRSAMARCFPLGENRAADQASFICRYSARPVSRFQTVRGDSLS